MTDPNNCGTCGHQCEGGDCKDGICQPTLFWQAGDAAAFTRGITIAESSVAWGAILTAGSPSTGVFSLPQTAAPLSVAMKHSDIVGVRLAYSTPWILWTNGTLHGAALTETDETTFGSGQCSSALAVGPQSSVFCVAQEGPATSDIWRYTSPYSKPATLWQTGLSTVTDIAIVGDSLFFGTASGLYRVSAAAPMGVPELVADDAVLREIEPFGGDLYFGGGGYLRRHNPEMASTDIVVTTPLEAKAIHVDANHIYVSESNVSVLRRYDHAGNAAGVWTLDSSDPHVMAGTTEYLFYTTYELGQVYRLVK